MKLGKLLYKGEVWNVRCGLYDWKGNQLVGCGTIGTKSAPLNNFGYKIRGYKTLWSSVGLCSYCEAKAKGYLKRGAK